MNTNYFSNVRILDGGMGQQLLAKGLKAKGSLWSATALIEKKYHQMVIDTHLDFINAGAVMPAKLCKPPSNIGL